MTHISTPRSIAVVTGGTSGIGLAIVKQLAASHLVYALGRTCGVFSQQVRA